MKLLLILCSFEIRIVNSPRIVRGIMRNLYATHSMDSPKAKQGMGVSMAKKRNGRQDAIRDIVRNKDVRTQRVLVDELKACGFDCTQATVSRDIADMGLRKLPEGMYVLAEDLHLQRMVSELVTGVVRAENLVLVKAQPGTASGIAAAIDAAELPDVLGSLAGNDTILVIAQTAEDGARFEGMISKLRSVRK